MLPESSACDHDFLAWPDESGMKVPSAITDGELACWLSARSLRHSHHTFGVCSLSDLPERLSQANWNCFDHLSLNGFKDDRRVNSSYPESHLFLCLRSGKPSLTSSISMFKKAVVTLRRVTHRTVLCTKATWGDDWNKRITKRVWNPLYSAVSEISTPFLVALTKLWILSIFDIAIIAGIIDVSGRNFLICPVLTLSPYHFSKLLPTFITLIVRSHSHTHTHSKSLYHKATTVNVAPQACKWKSLQSHNSELAQSKDHDKEHSAEGTM